MAAKMAGRSALTLSEAEALAEALGVTITLVVEPWTVADDSPGHVTREEAAAHFAAIARSLDE